METTFRAVFEAEDRSFSSSMRRMRDDSKLMASDMIADANRVAAATDQSVNKVLQEQISLYERGREVMKREERMRMDAKYGAAMSSAESPEDKSKIKTEWNEQKRLLVEGHKKDDVQILLLKEVIHTLRDTAQKELASDEKAAKENIRAVLSGDVEHMSPEAQYVARTQSEMVARDKGDKGVFNEVLLGTMIGNAVMSIGRTLSNMGAGAMQASDGEMMGSQLFAAIPYVGGALSAASARHLELSEQSDRLSMGLRSKGVMVDIVGGGAVSGIDKMSIPNFDKKTTTGVPDTAKDVLEAVEKERRIRDLRKKEWAAGTSGMAYDDPSGYKAEADALAAALPKKVEEKPLWSYNEAGVDRNEFLTMASRLLPAIGTGSGLNENVRSMIDITQGGGVSEANVISLANLMRMSGSTDVRSSMGSMVGILNYFGVNKAMRDTTIGGVTGIAQGMYDSGSASVDVNKIAAMSGAFYQNYGPALSSTSNIQSVMQSMSNPQTDYQQAINYRVYAAQRSKEGKATSYIDFMKWQEDPSQGLMGGKMDYLADVYGTGEFGAMAFKAAGIGKKYSAAEAYLKGGTKGLHGDVVATSETFDATGYTTERQRSQAELTDAFVVGMTEGMEKVFTQLGDSIAKKMSASGFPFADSFADWVKSMAEKDSN